MDEHVAEGLFAVAPGIDGGAREVFWNQIVKGLGPVAGFEVEEMATEGHGGAGALGVSSI